VAEITGGLCLPNGLSVQLPGANGFPASFPRETKVPLSIRFIERRLRIHSGTVRLIIGVLDLSDQHPHLGINGLGTRAARLCFPPPAIGCPYDLVISGFQLLAPRGFDLLVQTIQNAIGSARRLPDTLLLPESGEHRPVHRRTHQCFCLFDLWELVHIQPGSLPIATAMVAHMPKIDPVKPARTRPQPAPGASRIVSRRSGLKTPTIFEENFAVAHFWEAERVAVKLCTAWLARHPFLRSGCSLEDTGIEPCPQFGRAEKSPGSPRFWTRLSTHHAAQDASNFLGGHRQPGRYPRDLPPLPLPHFRNNQFRELFGDLLESPVADRSL
jgi:hypothetical protein